MLKRFCYILNHWDYVISFLSSTNLLCLTWSLNYFGLFKEMDFAFNFFHEHLLKDALTTINQLNV